MKKVCIAVFALMFLVSTAFAVNFQPKLLKLSVASKFLYNFDGKKLDIPVTVTGTPASAVFCVYTTGKAATVSKIRNGFLGWHYMNKVDTSVYVAKPVNLATGVNAAAISWDGKDKDGKIVPAGDYTYYIWAYDNVSAKVKVNNIIAIPSGSNGSQAHIQEIGADGKPLAAPIFFDRYGFSKFVIGGDPLDKTLVETTTYSWGSGFANGTRIALQPDNFNFFYTEFGSPATNKIKGVGKLQRVPNGLSQPVTTWGADGNGKTTWSSIWDSDGGCITDGDLLYTQDNAYHGLNDNKPLADFVYIDATDGSIIKRVDMTPFWSDLNDLNIGAQLNGGPNGFEMRKGMILLNCHCSCIKQMVDPTLEKDEFYKWSNENGDYVLDHNWLPTDARKWACNDYKVGPYTYHLSPDANLFSVAPSFDVGAVSFGLLGPDGTGIGYFPFAGETANWKRWSIFVDYNSPFDGIYTDNYSSADSSQQAGIWFVAHDSVKGTISNQTSVATAAPAVFAVAQNTPNPFNPTTTINFTLAKAGKVTVDIYNAAGQKVDTVANTTMNAGSHSVVWNAQRNSAGVYFYTVKAGSAAKTFKMTLLK